MDLLINRALGIHTMYSYNGNKIGQGKANVGTYLSENLDVASELETKIRQKEMGETIEKEVNTGVESE